jgi:acyl carrier protein
MDIGAFTMNFDKVRELIAETLGCDVEQVVDDAVLIDDLGADSLAIVELTMALEESTGVSIEDEALAGIKTVGDVMNYLTAHEG